MLFNNLIIIQNKERLSLYIVVASAALNIALNFVLIPKFSFYGAAWATVLAEIMNLYLLQHYSEWQMETKTAVKMAALLIGNILLLLLIRAQGYLNVWWLGVIIFGVDSAILLLSGLLKSSDIYMFLRPFKSKLASLWPAEGQAPVID